MIKTYTQLSKIEKFEDRVEYLRDKKEVGKRSFEGRRVVNQDFYHSSDWKESRRKVLLRDNGYDLGSQTNPIAGRIIVHHMNNVSERDLIERTPIAIDPEYLISTSHNTHEDIHFSKEITKGYVEREKYDTIPWKRGKHEK